MIYLNTLAPSFEYLDAPLHYALSGVAGTTLPPDLAPWPGLCSFQGLKDDGATREKVTAWLGVNCPLSWYTLGGVIDAAELLVERALENGNIRACPEYLAITAEYWAGKGFFYRAGGRAIYMPNSQVESGAVEAYYCETYKRFKPNLSYLVIHRELWQQLLERN